MFNFINKMFSSASADNRPGDNSPNVFFINQNGTDIQVDEHTALTYNAFWACVRYVSETVAILPWRVYRNEGASKFIDNKHAVDKLLHYQPNPEMTPFTFKETIVAHALTWGNGYAEIERNRLGIPVALWLMTPDRCELKRTDTGVLYYQITGEMGIEGALMPENVLHIKGLGFNGLSGYSVVDMAKESIGLGLAAQAFGAAFFGNGAHGSGVIEAPPDAKFGKDADGLKQLLAKFNQKYKGSRKSNKTLFLDKGMTYKSITIPPENAQFLQSRQFSVLEICRWFRVKPHKVGALENATYSNIEQESIDSVNDTIVPWAVRMEQEVNVKLLGDRERYSRFILQALLRGDSKARSDFYKVMSALGAFSINDVLLLEDMNPIGELGDVRLVPLNMTTLENINQAASHKDLVKAASLKVFEDVASRMARKEFKASQAASKKMDSEAFEVWANNFYTKEKEPFVNGFAGCTKMIGELMKVRDMDALRSVTTTLVHLHCDNSRAALRDNMNVTSEEFQARAEALAASLVQSLVLTGVMK